MNLARVLGVLALASLAACYRGPGTENPENVRGAPFAPWGVVVPAGVTSAREVDGIYLSSRRDACCGVTREAAFRVRESGPPKYLYLHFYVPDFSDQTQRPQPPQSVEVIFSPEHRRRFGGYAPNSFGLIKVAIPRDAALDRGLLSLKVRMGWAVRPGDFQKDGDRNSYSLVLLDADVGP